ncbi:hypothetical protein COO91_03217 [Nostoc flagelliforme CCNUN1]|uniref:Uncharacterized protein n=1 Tax=Nostoc flagelliforme CCNUN1 TaxID=2038116 RepID=A0A2K8SPB0_9NOSO|nr:hypothetical protein COO91_03217 [Nostoc flagelliforme CCNUN1]
MGNEYFSKSFVMPNTSASLRDALAFAQYKCPMPNAQR